MTASRATIVKALGLALAVALVAFTATGAVMAAAAKADFTLTGSSAQSVAAGQVATYTVSATVNNGFNSPLALSASNLPAGASATFSPATLTAKTTSALAISVGSTTPPGTYPAITITGTGGGSTHAITLSLTVTAAVVPTFILAVSPPSVTVLPADTARYTVSTPAVNGFTGSVVFSIAGLPTAATALLSPSSTPVGSSTALTVVTKNSTPGGTYSLTVTATSGARQVTTSLTLIVALSGKAFPITLAGPLGPLAPGVARPANLALTNPNSQPLAVTNITVVVQSVATAPGAPAGRSCTPADYSVRQFSGNYPLTIPAGATVALAGLGVSAASWPAVTMTDTSVNQDGCKGATLVLGFSGLGQG